MSKYEITYKCGHKKTIELFGKMSERENKIKRLEQQDCNDCKRLAGKNQKGKDLVGLPDLTGSDKQIDFALQIRLKFVKDIRELELNMPDNAKNSVEAWLSSKTESNWWINNRCNNAKELLVINYAEIRG